MPTLLVNSGMSPRLLLRVTNGGPGIMTSVGSELLVAIIKLAALQVRFDLLAVEVAALNVEQIPKPLPAKESQVAHRSFDAEVEAAARVFKARLLGGKEGGFQNMLRINFPDDEIRAMAEAALTAARQAE
jgi:hypothetical protein